MPTKKHIIDLEAMPTSLHDSWKIEEHQGKGRWEWNPKELELYLSAKQKIGRVEGDKLRQRISHPLNANVLDYLLKNPELIPDDWKGKYIFFWGTVYRDDGGGLHVRCIGWYSGGWRWSFQWLEGGWCRTDPAVVLASSPKSPDPKTSLDPLNLAVRVERIEKWFEQHGFSLPE
jgi:hypothetical protein